MSKNKQHYDVIEHMRAAVFFINSDSGMSKSGRAFAHVSVLYPNMPLAKRLKLARAVAESQEESNQ